MHAHRFAAFLAGKIENLKASDHTAGDDLALHSCDNTACCNDAHLKAGTALRNCEERYERGRARHPRGMDVSASKLTDAEVLRIRSLCAKGAEQKSIAARFGVSRAAVCRVVNRKAWGHI